MGEYRLDTEGSDERRFGKLKQTRQKKNFCYRNTVRAFSMMGSLLMSPEEARVMLARYISSRSALQVPGSSAQDCWAQRNAAG